MMTTIEAITELLNDSEKCAKIGMTPANQRVLKFRLKNRIGENPSIYRWLILAGYKQTTTWQRKKK